VIHVDRVSKTYVSGGRSIAALRDVTLQIRAGEVFGVIGRSGAGKSTLIRMLNLLERPGQGRVRVDGDDITAFSSSQLREYRRRVGMIFQHFNLLRSRTVMDNVCFPLRLAGMPRAQRRQRAREVLELVELAGYENSYPSQLSGGQQQRVGIARALANRPRLLLCDEATSALDPQTTQSILELLRSINEQLQLTIVLITHGMDVIRALCDRVAVLDAGALVEQGTVVDVFLRPRHAATRALLAESGMSAGNDWEALAADVPGWLVRLSYEGAATTQPMLSRISRELQLDLSILQGSVGTIKNTPYGQMVVAANGRSADLQAMIPALDAAGVHCEVLRG